MQVLETCVKNCGHRFHVQVATRDFIDGVLVKIISPKTNPPTIVQDKVLSLIQVFGFLSSGKPVGHYMLHFPGVVPQTVASGAALQLHVESSANRWCSLFLSSKYL